MFVGLRTGNGIPAGVQHAAVAAAGHQGRRSGRRGASSGDGRDGSL